MRRECRERFPCHRLQRKPLECDPGIHHDTCVTHVPWCMSGSLFSGGGENVPGIPGACTTRNFTYLARGPWTLSATVLVMTYCLNLISQVYFVTSGKVHDQSTYTHKTQQDTFTHNVSKIYGHMFMKIHARESFMNVLLLNLLWHIIVW